MNLPDAWKHAEKAIGDISTAANKLEDASNAVANDPKVSQALTDVHEAVAAALDALNEIKAAIKDLVPGD